MATSGPITYLVMEDQFLSVAATQAPASDYGDVEPDHPACAVRSGALRFVADESDEELLEHLQRHQPQVLWETIVLSALVLFGVGTYQAVTLVGDWRKKGLQMVVIGLGAAAIGFLIGRLFHTAGA